MNYLITGIAGSGKSTVAEALLKKGCEVIDADEDHSHWLEHATGNTYSSRPYHKNWRDHFDWIWNVPKMNELLSRKRDHDLFVCGVGHNQADFYSQFDKIFLLVIDEKTMVKRLTGRTNNPFGTRPGDIEQCIAWRPQFQALVEAAGAIKIDATQSLDKIIDEILN
jgi:dephospho-CoA kinase